MVHKKYIKINGKKYGPYYYESYRENGKIKKRYIKVLNRGLEGGLTGSLKRSIFKINSPYAVVYLAIVFVLIMATLFSYFSPLSFGNLDIGQELLLAPAEASYGGSDNANLSIWDDSDEPEIERYTQCSQFCAQKIKPLNLWNIFFIANYTDNTGNAIDNMNGLCRIRFDVGGEYFDMSFDVFDSLWKYNSTFIYKGEDAFDVNCTSGYGNVTLDNNFFITNTVPYIIKTASGYIDFNGDGAKDILQCREDVLCNYYFGSNVSEDDLNDVLNYGYIANSNTTLANFTLNSITGVLAVNVTLDQNTCSKRVELSVVDSESPTQSALLDVNIVPVNDKPYFINLINKSVNMTDLFDYKILAGDEEGDMPFRFNITFLSCNTAEWSDRGSADCDLFNETQYSVNETAILIYFVPTRNDVGNYIINFSVTDLNNRVQPYNASYSEIVNFTILNLNVQPELLYVCDNERSAVEDSYFSCHINASDIDEVKNLSFMSDRKWFLDFKQAIVNSSTNYIGNIEVNFTPNDREVGNWEINVSVKDSYGPPGRDNLVFQFLVSNVNNKVYLNEINDVVVYTSNNYYSFYINATDDDLLIPDKILFNEDLTFSSNYSCVGINSKEVISDSNMTRALIEFNPNNGACFGGGNEYNVNISVVDMSGNMDSKVFVIAVVGNNAPLWDSNTNTQQVLVEDSNFYLNLSENVSDPDNQHLVFLFVKDDDLRIPLGQKGFYDEILTLELNISGPNINLFSFSFPDFLSPDREMFFSSFTPKKTDIGQYNVSINVTDSSGSSSFIYFNLSVIEINHAPVLMNLSNQTGAANQLLYYNINAFDVEDGNDSEGRLVFSYEFLSGRDFIMGNESIFNLTSGVLSYTFNESDGGRYHIKVYVNDSVNMQDSKDFWIFVHGQPVIYSPSDSYVFNLTEGKSRQLIFMANDSLENDLTYEFYLNEEMVYNLSYYGNGTKLIWDYTPSYTSETYGLFSNLTLNVNVPGLNFLNSSRTWNINISHANAPVQFIKNIGDKEGVYGKNIEINLTSNFYDTDVFDSHYNQQVIFVVASNSSPSRIINNTSNWILSFSASQTADEIFNITAWDINGSGSVLSRAYSNNFEIKFKEPEVITVPVVVPSTGGGGGSSQTSTEKPVSFKLILPGAVSARKGDIINLPISLFNDGTLTFNDLNLSALIAKDGKIMEGANISFDT